MDARELRIGNLILANGTISIVITIKGYEVLAGSVETSHTETVYLDDCEEIPLTEEWILKFGFEKVCKSKYGNKYRIPADVDWGFTIENSYNEGEWFFGFEYYDSPNEIENYQSLNFCYDLKSVHRLQNLYHAPTGKELTTKNQ